jgi:hypothetical protein
MSIFKNMKSEGLEKSQDRLGGFQPIESDIYSPCEVKALFAGQSKGGAFNLTLIAGLPDGKEYRETIYISNKSGENFFLDKQSKKKMPLPGFTLVNDLCLITTGKELADLETEEKVVKVWDPDTKSEQPKAVQMVMEAIGQKVALGILKQLENKNKKEGDEYVPTMETQEVNNIDKVFHPEHKITVAEAREGKMDGAFWGAWLKRNQGQTRDRRTLKEGSGSGGGTPPKSGGSSAVPPAAKKSLFGK